MSTRLKRNILKKKGQAAHIKIFFTIRMLKRKLQKDQTAFPKFKTDIQLSDNQRLDEYGLNAKIIHIPGHGKPFSIKDVF